MQDLMIFDVDVPHENINHLKETLPRDENLYIDHKDVVKLFPGLNVRKASGPDNISPLILKNVLINSLKLKNSTTSGLLH